MDNWKDAVDIYSKEENCDQSRLGGKTRSSVWNISLKCVLHHGDVGGYRSVEFIFKVWNGDINLGVSSK